MSTGYYHGQACQKVSLAGVAAACGAAGALGAAELEAGCARIIALAFGVSGRTGCTAGGGGCSHGIIEDVLPEGFTLAAECFHFPKLKMD